MSTDQKVTVIGDAAAAHPPGIRFYLRGWRLPAILLAAYAVLAATSALQKSNTFDELVYLTSGYSYWVKNDYRLNPEAGNFPQRWAALPLLLWENIRFPSENSLEWRHADLWAVGRAFLFQLENDAKGMLFAGRMMVLLLGLLLGSLVYRWAARLGGAWAGGCALALFAFSPTILAHSRLITSDLAAALAFSASTMLFWRMLNEFSLVRVLASSAAMGFLFLSKMSAVLMIPICLLLLLARLGTGSPLDVPGGPPIRDRGQQAFLFIVAGAVHILVVWLMIWTAFGFRYSAFANASEHRETIREGQNIRSLSSDIPLGGAVRFAADTKLLPQGYLFGFAYILKHAELRSAFLSGRYSLQGWPEFFPSAFVIKTPLSILLALVLTAALCLHGFSRHVRRMNFSAWRSRIDEFFPLAALLAVYGFAAVTSQINIGHRHLLPIYPPLFIFAGVGLAKLRQVSAVGRRLAWAVPVLLAAESLSAWPHYLAYFNPLVGGPRHGYRHLVDSSLDWGQDLPALKAWIDRHEAGAERHAPVYLSYFGTADPKYYGIRARQLPGFMDFHVSDDCSSWSGGVYCISATNLQSVYSPARGPWTADYEADYQQMLQSVRPTRSAAPKGTPQAARFRPKCRQLQELQLARLCAYLRKREPDDHVGYSILIYRLSDRDIHDALHGPSPLEDRGRIRE